MNSLQLAARSTLAVLLFCAALEAQAHGFGTVAIPAPAGIAVTAPLAPAQGVEDLRFGEVFELPVGPRGLVPSARLRALQGQLVRVVGYMAHDADRPAGLVVLSPLPVTLGGEDERFADDLPANAIYARLVPSLAQARVPPLAGLLVLSGRLELGDEPETDGRHSWVRLLLDEDTSRRLVQAARPFGGLAWPEPVEPRSAAAEKANPDAR